MRILVLGGAGAMARVTVRDLLASDGVDAVGVADLHLDRAKEAVRSLGSDRAVALEADVRDRSSLVKTLREWDVAINETWYELNLDVMDAAIAAGVHYLDLGGLYHMTLKQLDRDREARDAGVTCLLGIGSTPGTMNVMAAYGAAQLDSIAQVKLRSAGAVVSGTPEGFSVPYSIRTILDEFSLDAPVFRDGRIRLVPPLTGRERFELPAPVGRVEGYYTIHSELATLPQNLGKGLREMDFIVAFDPAFTEVLATLARLGLTSRTLVRVGDKDVVPYRVTAAVVDALPKPKGPVLDVDIQRCELHGSRGGKPVTLVYDCISSPNMDWMIDGGTVGTGTPPSIAARWLATGRITTRGVVPPEVAIDPLPFLQELGARGRTIEVWEGGKNPRRIAPGP